MIIQPYIYFIDSSDQTTEAKVGSGATLTFSATGVATVIELKPLGGVVNVNNPVNVKDFASAGGVQFADATANWVGPTSNLKGAQGFQGNTISWWNAYTSTFNNQTTAPPGDKTFRRGTNPAYDIDSTNYSDINLETLVTKGVLRKEADTPESGYTTYTLLRNITIDTGTSTTDILDTNYLQLLEGYIFNGNGFTITVNNSGNDANNSQGGIFSQGAETYLTNNVYEPQSGGMKYINTNVATLYSQQTGVHYFRVAPSGSADAAISWTTAMTMYQAQSGAAADISMGARWSGDGGGKTDFQTNTNVSISELSNWFKLLNESAR